MTIINKDCNPDFCDHQQPLELFTDINTLEKGVRRLLTLADTSQRKLILALIQYKFNKNGITYYNPGVKSYESALRKAKASYGVPNQIRQLTDVYRASIIFDNPDQIDEILLEIKTILKNNKFEIVYEKNSFENPWNNGYRDINFKIKDLDNMNLIGELQINQCSVKLFTELIGHKAYEIKRVLNKNTKNIVGPYLNQLTQYGYNKSSKEIKKCSSSNNNHNNLSRKLDNLLLELRKHKSQLSHKKTNGGKKNRKTKKSNKKSNKKLWRK